MLLEFRVKNFLSIKDLKVSFNEDTNFYAIFGANGSGKTNFLDAIKFAFKKCIQNRYIQSIDDYRESDFFDDDRDIEFSSQFYENLYLKRKFRYEDIKNITFGIKCKINNIIYDYEYTYTYTDGSDGTLLNNIIEEKLVIDNKVYLDKFKITDDNLQKNLKDNNIVVEHLEATRRYNVLLFNHLLNNNVAKYNNEINLFDEYIRSFNVLNNRIPYDLFFPEEDFCRKLKEIENIDIENNTHYSKEINKYIKILDKTFSKYEIQINDKIKSRYKNRKNIENSKSFKVFFVSENGEKFAFSEISSGTRLLLYKYMITLLTAYGGEKDKKQFKILFLIDEIERGINAHLLERYVDIVSNNKYLQFIVTTHSTDMLDYLTKKNILIAERDGKTFETKINNILDVKIEDKDLRNAYIYGKLNGIPDIAK